MNSDLDATGWTLLFTKTSDAEALAPKVVIIKGIARIAPAIIFFIQLSLSEIVCFTKFVDTHYLKSPISE